jgi:Holliday junction resolvase
MVTFRRRKVDGNQALIISTLRHAGATVVDLAAVGSGCPDLLVGYNQRTFLFEVKDGGRAPSKRRLNPLQKAWHESWRGYPAFIVTNEAEALQFIGYYTLNPGAT